MDDLGQWSCHEFNVDDTQSEETHTSIIWSLVVLPEENKVFAASDLSGLETGNKTQFLKQEAVITAQEGENVKLYCAILVRKQLVTDVKNVLKWSPVSRLPNSSLDLSSQVTNQFFVQNNDDLLGFLNILTIYNVERKSNMENIKCSTINR